MLVCLLLANDALFNAICRLAVVSTNGRPPHGKHNTYGDQNSWGFQAPISSWIGGSLGDLVTCSNWPLTTNDNNDTNHNNQDGEDHNDSGCL